MLSREIRKSIYNLCFKLACLGAVVSSFTLVVTLVIGLALQGWSGFFQTYVVVSDDGDMASVVGSIADSLSLNKKDMTQGEKNELRGLISSKLVKRDNMVLVSAPLDQFFKGKNSKLSPNQREWAQNLKSQSLLVKKWNWDFFTNPDSREGELAGMGGALLSSAMIVAVMLSISLPLGLASALHLQEFSRKRSFPLFSMLINNLAAVPSILFGMLGLVLFIDLIGLPRSSSLVGGIVLALMVLPTLIISCRSALASVPQYLRNSAYALGASKVQTVFHHVILYASPSLLTSFILSVCQAIGQTAPLLMIGMMAFSPSVPSGFLDTATGLPVQIYLWSDHPDGSFMEKAAAAVLCLLGFLILLNLSMFVSRLYLRKKYPVNN